ncbi:restriction endonuclease subunit S [Rothia sp. SD9660Na]|uniref:restriction endonuclease subunit S n=1 Tax=Rothia sp. SD9660Na TaxID=3047030 RepID=UPI0024B88E4B|nr:restriction endonuclease subunit S [Rothia sp. SD9660Na]WHS49629.1 restriction endonuclease subunit S [Rothia sp. SD9660Na]
MPGNKAYDWFGGSVRSGWRIVRLGSVFRERNEPTTAEDLAPLSVTKKGVVEQQESVAISAIGAPKKVARKGDFVINSRSDRKGSAGIAPRDGSVSLINIVLEPKGIYPQFAKYLLTSVGFQEEFYRFGSGIVADLWTTRYSAMKAIQIPLPPLEEQKQIADDLDRELAEIDEFIDDQQRLQDLLQERLVSLTFDLATDASNPDRYDTGHPFWKTLPRGWTLQKLGWHFKIGNGSTPLSTNESYWSDDSTDIPWFNSSTVNQELAIEPARYVTELAVKECHLPMIPKGSLLMGLIGQGKTRGKVTKTGIDATLSQNIAYLTPMQNSQVSIDFTKLALEAAYPELREINSGNGTTKGSLTCENIQQFRIPFPSINQQHSILQKHNYQKNINSKLSTAVELSDLLQERKNRYIKKYFA